MIGASMARLQAWCAAQPGVRLVLGPPFDDAQIDALPQLIAGRNPGLPVPFRPDEFPVPPSYRDFLRTCSSARIEYRDGDAWVVYEPVNIFGPDEVAAGYSFTDAGTTVDDGTTDGEIQSTFLVAFATAGYETEASRWCFHTDDDIPCTGDNGELPILLECNDFECDLAKFVDTGEWVDGAFNTPAAMSFAQWLDTLVTVVTTRPFSARRRDDTIPDSFYLDARHR
jgi:hypothetical protein